MPQLLQLLSEYGYVVLFGSAFLEQMGLPLPAATLLVAMGALARSGDTVFGIVVAAAALAALIADLIWFMLGKIYGRSILRLLCRISLEPDFCVRRTEDKFERLGMLVLLPAKFIPGFNAAAVPLAGMIKTPLLRFLAVDIPGVLLWSTAYTLLGYIFSAQIERVITYLSGFGTGVLILIAITLTLYVGRKVQQRHYSQKTLSASRITPEAVKAKLDRKERILIFDTRNRLDRKTDPVRIPGAFHVLPEHIDFQPGDIGRDQDIVIYCSCPNEATSARVALHLQRRGLLLARPLEGGLEGWRQRDFPLERLD